MVSHVKMVAWKKTRNENGIVFSLALGLSCEAKPTVAARAGEYRGGGVGYGGSGGLLGLRREQSPVTYEREP